MLLNPILKLLFFSSQLLLVNPLNDQNQIEFEEKKKKIFRMFLLSDF